MKNDTSTEISRKHEARLLAAYAAMGTPGIGTEDEVRTALSVLMRLSGQSQDGRLRDQIAAVRHELHDALGE